MPISVPGGSGGSGGGFIPGPTPNTFSSTTITLAEGLRDTQATSDPTWLAAYDADRSLSIALTETTTNTTQYQVRVASAWVNIVNAIKGDKGDMGNKGDPGADATVITDATLTGVGTSGDPLSIVSPFTSADETKLDGIEATADVTDQANVYTALKSILQAGGNITLTPDDSLNQATIASADEYLDSATLALSSSNQLSLTLGRSGSLSDVSASVSLSGLSGGGGTPGGVDIPVQTSAPSAPSTNDLWIDTSGDPAIFRVYDGANWDPISADGYVTGLSFAISGGTLQITATRFGALADLTAQVDLTNTTIPVADIAPTSPSEGDLWVNTTGNTTLLQIYDGTTWSEISGTGTGTVIPVQDTAPTNPSEGDLWVNTTGSTTTLQIYDGSAWVDVAGAAGADNYADTLTLGLSGQTLEATVGRTGTLADLTATQDLSSLVTAAGEVDAIDFLVNVPPNQNRFVNISASPTDMSIDNSSTTNIPSGTIYVDGTDWTVVRMSLLDGNGDSMETYIDGLTGTFNLMIVQGGTNNWVLLTAPTVTKIAAVGSAPAHYYIATTSANVSFGADPAGLPIFLTGEGPISGGIGQWRLSIGLFEEDLVQPTIDLDEEDPTRVRVQLATQGNPYPSGPIGVVLTTQTSGTTNVRVMGGKSLILPEAGQWSINDPVYITRSGVGTWEPLWQFSRDIPTDGTQWRHFGILREIIDATTGEYGVWVDLTGGLEHIQGVALSLDSSNTLTLSMDVVGDPTAIGGTVDLSALATDEYADSISLGLSGTNLTATVGRTGSLSDLTASQDLAGIDTDNYADSVSLSLSGTTLGATVGRTGALADLTASQDLSSIDTDNYADTLSTSVSGSTLTTTLGRTGTLADLTATATLPAGTDDVNLRPAVEIQATNIGLTSIANEALVVPLGNYDEIGILQIAEELAGQTSYFPDGPIGFTVGSIGAGATGRIRLVGHMQLVLAEAIGQTDLVGEPIYIQQTGTGTAPAWQWTLTEPTSTTTPWKRVGWVGEIFDETTGELGLWVNFLRDVDSAALDIYANAFVHTIAGNQLQLTIGRSAGQPALVNNVDLSGLTPHGIVEGLDMTASASTHQSPTAIDLGDWVYTASTFTTPTTGNVHYDSTAGAYYINHLDADGADQSTALGAIATGDEVRLQLDASNYVTLVVSTNTASTGGAPGTDYQAIVGTDTLTGTIADTSEIEAYRSAVSTGWTTGSLLVPTTDFAADDPVEMVTERGDTNPGFAAGPVAIALSDVLSGNTGLVRAVGHVNITHSGSPTWNVGDSIYASRTASNFNPAYTLTNQQPTSGSWKRVGSVGSEEGSNVFGCWVDFTGGLESDLDTNSYVTTAGLTLGTGTLANVMQLSLARNDGLSTLNANADLTPMLTNEDAWIRNQVGFEGETSLGNWTLTSANPTPPGGLRISSTSIAISETDADGNDVSTALNALTTSQRVALVRTSEDYRVVTFNNTNSSGGTFFLQSASSVLTGTLASGQTVALIPFAAASSINASTGNMVVPSRDVGVNSTTKIRQEPGNASNPYEAGPVGVMLANVAPNAEGLMREAGVVSLSLPASGNTWNVGSAIYAVRSGTGTNPAWVFASSASLTETQQKVGIVLTDLGSGSYLCWVDFRGVEITVPRVQELFNANIDLSVTTYTRVGTFTWNRTQVGDYEKVGFAFGVVNAGGSDEHTTAFSYVLGADIKGVTTYNQTNPGDTPTSVADNQRLILELDPGQTDRATFVFTNNNEIWANVNPSSSDPNPLRIWVESDTLQTTG